MKERWRLSKEKLVSAEEGLKPTIPVTGGSSRSCDRLIQYAKLVLYIELILFLGWSSYTLWQAYDQQTEISFFNVFPSKYAAFRDAESSTVSTQVLKSSESNDFKDTIGKIKTTENSLSVEHNLIANHFETTTTNAELKGSLESSNSDGDKEIIVKVPRLDVHESKKTESLEDGSVIELEFPLPWSIHKEIGPLRDDSSESASESKLEKSFERLYESNGNDDTIDVSEFRQTSSEKETEQQNKNEKSAISEDVPLSIEILKSIRDFPKDLVLENFDDYDFLERSDNSKEDKIFDSLKFPKPSSYDWIWWYADDFKEPSFWGESTESSSVPPNLSNKEESDNFSTQLNRGELEKFDSLETEKLTSDSKSNNWDLQLSSQSTTDEINTNQKQTTTNWAEWYSTAEVNSTDESTEKNRETSTEVIYEDDNTSDRGQMWPLVFSWHHDTAATDNVDSEASPITNEEENNLVMDTIWKPYPNMYHNFPKFLQMENGNSEKEATQFGPRIKHEDSTEHEPCTVQFVHGLKVMKCLWSSVDSDRSFDSSDTTESNSDSSTKSHVVFLRKNYGIFDKISEKENVPDNTELFDEKSNLYDSDVIDEIEKESLKISPSSEDSSVTSEAFKFGVLKLPASSTFKDSAVSSLEFDWHLPFGQTETSLDPEDSYVEKMNGEINAQDLPHKTEIMKKTNRRYANEDSDESMVKFYSTMEILSAHIDALHERYLREHQLEDDYISQELPNENYMKITNNNVSPAA